MTRPLLLSLLVILLGCSAGCSFFRKEKRAKESTAIASDVEATFRRRWLEKRTGELVAGGMAADAARAQADEEFRQRYSFATPAKK